MEDLTAVNDFFITKSKALGKTGNTFMQAAQASFRFLKEDPNFKGRPIILQPKQNRLDELQLVLDEPYETL